MTAPKTTENHRPHGDVVRLLPVRRHQTPVEVGGHGGGGGIDAGVEGGHGGGQQTRDDQAGQTRRHLG